MKRVNVLAKQLAATYTVDDLVAKREEGQVWIAIKNKVYDVTEFLDDHPGGAELITDIPMRDVQLMTTEFDDAEHSEEAMEQLVPLFRGMLVSQDGPPAMVQEEADEEEEEDESAHAPPLRDSEYSPTPFSQPTHCRLLLDSKEHISHDVTVYRFQLPKPELGTVFSLPIGKHIVLSYLDDVEGKHVSRAYTPVSPKGDVGFVDFLIKRYPGGKMTQHLERLRPQQDSLQMFGPKGKLSYLGDGQFSLRKQGKDVLTKLSHVGMIAGGSGITPMFQIIQAVAHNIQLGAQDGLRLTLLFANKTEEDMILRHALEALAALVPPGQITIAYTLDTPPETGYSGEVGFITQDMLAKYMPEPAEDTMVFLCGPPPMINKACLPALKALGFAKDKIFKF